MTMMLGRDAAASALNEKKQTKASNDVLFITVFKYLIGLGF
jgi:hypothetical protein